MLTRRELLGLLAAGPALLRAASCAIAADDRRDRLGVVTYSYGAHASAGRANSSPAAFRDALGFLDFCHERGAGGIQAALGRSAADAARLRAKAEAHGMYVEGIVSLPRSEADVDRFDADIRTAKEAGADVVRSALLGGRRYETFDTAEAFRRFTEQSRKSLALAEPVLRKHRVRLGVENHKDHRVPELLEHIRRLSSESVGICVDTGNSIALLEEPMVVVEAYAPWAVTTHLKDMAVAEYADGFLLSEVPLGEGFLDLTKMVATLRKAAPKVRFNLEMITRDPLKVPCLTEKYWATFEAVPGRDLARMLRLVRAKAAKQPLPRVTGLSLEEKLKREDENVRQCLRYAHERLGL
jgi:sugar phosphate isomerase/epimerase